MGQDPSDIRAEIEDTRMRVGEEVDALSYKTDVGARASDFVAEKKEAMTSKLSGAKDVVTKPVPSRRQMREVKYTAERNPLGLAIGGAAVGFVVGLLIPSTRMEDEKLGEVSDRASDLARDTLERGKQVAQEAAQSAVETAKESGRQQGEELTSTLQERTQQSGSSEPQQYGQMPQPGQPEPRPYGS